MNEIECDHAPMLSYSKKDREITLSTCRRCGKRILWNEDEVAFKVMPRNLKVEIVWSETKKGFILVQKGVKTQIVIDVNVAQPFVLSLNPRSRAKLGDQEDVDVVFVRFKVGKKFSEVPANVLYMATRMLCPNTPRYEYLDILFRDPVKRKVLRRLI